MKLCIPSSRDDGRTAPTGEHFGRAAWFHVYDTETGEITSVANPSGHAHHGQCHHVDQLKSLGVDAVAGARIGRNAIAGLHAAGILVWDAAGSTVGEVVDTIGAGRARPIAVDEGCHGEAHRHGHGHGDGHGHGNRACRHHAPAPRS